MRAADPPARLEATHPAEPGEVMPLVRRIADFARAHGLDAEQVGRIELITEEAVANVARHAYPEAPGPMTVLARWDPAGRLILEVCDQGPPFDPLQAPPPDLEADALERPLGGLGIHLLRELTDAMTYRREAGENRLLLEIRSVPPAT